MLSKITFWLKIAQDINCFFLSWFSNAEELVSNSCEIHYWLHDVKTIDRLQQWNISCVILQQWNFPMWFSTDCGTRSSILVSLVAGTAVPSWKPGGTPTPLTIKPPFYGVSSTPRLNASVRIMLQDSLFAAELNHKFVGTLI